MSLGAWVALALAAAPLLALAAAVLAWWRWRRGLLAASRAAGHVARTARGPVEYAVAGHGPPLLVIHGGMGGHDQALGLGALVNGHAGAAGLTVLAPSRPGYSRTPLEVGRTPQEQADALAAWLDHLGVSQVGVLAGSYGGPVAVQLALRHPHRLWALVLLAAVLRRSAVGQQWPLSERALLSRPGGLLIDLLHWLLHLRARYRPLALVRDFMRRMTARSVDDAEIDRRVARLGQFPEQLRAVQALFCSMMPLSVQMAGCLNDEKQIAGLPDYPLEGVRAPTLFVHGREDCVGPGAAGAEWAAAKVPGARLFLVERCGHFMQAGEHVGPVFSAVAEFLCEHAPPRGGAGPVPAEPHQEMVGPVSR
jgi:pimeloyl-ACP methyl ester carboxylesterase